MMEVNIEKIEKDLVNFCCLKSGAVFYSPSDDSYYLKVFGASGNAVLLLNDKKQSYFDLAEFEPDERVREVVGEITIKDK